jgi:hypothetical protein
VVLYHPRASLPEDQGIDLAVGGSEVLTRLPLVDLLNLRGTVYPDRIEIGGDALQAVVRLGGGGGGDVRKGSGYSSKMEVTTSSMDRCTSSSSVSAQTMAVWQARRGLIPLAISFPA